MSHWCENSIIVITISPLHIWKTMKRTSAPKKKKAHRNRRNRSSTHTHIRYELFHSKRYFLIAACSYFFSSFFIILSLLCCTMWSNSHHFPYYSAVPQFQCARANAILLRLFLIISANVTHDMHSVAFFRPSVRPFKWIASISQPSSENRQFINSWPCEESQDCCSWWRKWNEPTKSHIFLHWEVWCDKIQRKENSLTKYVCL